VIRVVVAEDQALVRRGLCGILDEAPDITVVGDVGDGAEAVSAASELRPDVVVMDVRMPVMDGIEATRRIVRDGAARVLLLTTFDVDDYVLDGMRAGATGFLLKDAQPLELYAGVRAVASGEALLAPTATRRLIQRIVSDGPPAARRGELPELTPRERDVLALVAEGLSNAEIAARLYVSAGTVKTHVAHLLTKFAARDRLALAIAAFRAGVAQ
jgi:DNA-binding NarL/FixJ family response regulator